MRKILFVVTVGICVSVICFYLLEWNSWWHMTCATLLGILTGGVCFEPKEIGEALKDEDLHKRITMGARISAGIVGFAANVYLWIYVSCLIGNIFFESIDNVVTATIIFAFLIPVVAFANAGFDSDRYDHGNVLFGKQRRDNANETPISFLFNSFLRKKTDKIFLKKIPGNPVEKIRWVRVSFFFFVWVCCLNWISLLITLFDVTFLFLSKIATRKRIAVVSAIAVGSLAGCLKCSLTHDIGLSLLQGLSFGFGYLILSQISVFVRKKTLNHVNAVLAG